MNKTTKKILLQYVLAPVLLLIFLWLIYRQIQNQGSFRQEWQTFYRQLNVKSLLLVTLVILLAPLNWLTEAQKWHLLLNRIEQISLKKAFISVLSGMAFAFVTPNRAGDFIGRVLFLEKQNRLRGTIAALIGSLSQMVVTFGFGFLGMAYLHIFHPASWTLWVLIAAAAGLAILLFGYLNIRLLSRLSGKFRKLRSLILALYLFKRYSRKELWKVLGIALLRFLIYNGQFLILLWAFDTQISVGTGFLLSGLMFWLITVIPTFFVADIGIRGLITALLFVNTGIAANAFSVLAASYTLWLINMVMPAIAGSIFSTIKGSLSAK
ncbi:MAG TPA: lysylphosphatidylglycerol synthase domain-containing protein [Edaphocola sp.]|nr:lysylphosphatidylglycerol synthase domain-containing protein [Edaphocola sp.]